MKNKSIYKLVMSDKWKIIIIMVFICYFVSRNNYTLFHSLIEMSTIAISLAVMLVAVGTVRICENNWFTYLGIIYGFVGIIDMFHTLTYKGINIIVDNPDISIQLWVGGRYYESIALIFSIYYLNNKLKAKKVVVLNLVIVSIMLCTILFTNIFPMCYIDGYGLTKFKVISEYIISTFFMIFAFFINNNYKIKKVSGSKLIFFSIIFKIFSELLFTFYIDAYGLFNFLGHTSKLIAAYLLFKALFESVISDPYKIIFEKINLKATEFERKNEELVFSKNKLEEEYYKIKRFIELLPEGVMLIEDEKIIYANSKMASLLGIEDKDSIINSSIFDLVDYEYKGKLVKRLSSKDKTEVNNPEEGKLSFNGRELDIEIYTLFLKNIVEEECNVSIIRDISDRKRALEMELLLIEKEKEDKLINDFFTNISHELKTPINVIYSALQLEELYLNDKDVRTISNYNNIIKQNCLRLIRTTNNIIDATKIQAGFFVAKLKKQNIVNIIEEITLSIASYANCKDMNIIFDTECEEIYVNCDENLIERIILNLLSNSVKYCKKNGNIEVSIYKVNENIIEISVKDDGIGIPNEAQNMIFEKFEKVDKSNSRIAEGTGMGLFLVKTFVEMHKGAISINKNYENGTEFLIRIPCVKTNEAAYSIISHSEYRTIRNLVEKINIEFSDVYSA
ncbi:MASE3 domain-containing sensor histidine kinase [Clostridium saccharoperbutylacetonicum]|uniref:sensor histidine kinase n=1 Tax=Clostridium saccharoperbutylacetonicum TaxID=36745 RepID=UPI000983EDCD|nr:MASE3 domain-containing protein [Clostridium saccharoperbutylacetonicum]AQR96586.1 sensor histidine kinase TodS [Clostridium saccharoperbutylacetonicum]NSB32462.1 PAS domain S-box-containing protein [Clostridium saccharoperbutylacetonicum]